MNIYTLSFSLTGFLCFRRQSSFLLSRCPSCHDSVC